MIVKVLRYSAIDSPEDIHPLDNMKRLGLDNYYRSSPEPIFDCWLFVYKEWPDVELPNYIKRVELDDEKWPQLKKGIVVGVRPKKSEYEK